MEYDIRIIWAPHVLGKDAPTPSDRTTIKRKLESTEVLSLLDEEGLSIQVQAGFGVLMEDDGFASASFANEAASVKVVASDLSAFL